MSRTFPQVIASALDGKWLSGQPVALTSVNINGIEHKASVTSSLAQGRTDRINYTLSFADLPGITITAHIALIASSSSSGAGFEFAIDAISDPKNSINTIQFNRQQLVSVNSQAPRATASVSVYSPDSTKSGDTFFQVTKASAPDAAPVSTASPQLVPAKWPRRSSLTPNRTTPRA